MTTPKDSRPFDAELAKQGCKIGIEGSDNNVRLICVDKVGGQPVVVLSKPKDGFYDTHAEKIFCFSLKGERSGGAKLVMLSSGTVQGKSVFVGDKVLGAGGGEVTITSQMNQRDFDKCSWPKSAHVVETRMTKDDCADAWNPPYGYSGLQELANKAIARSIADGDVIPTAVAKELIIKMLVGYPCSHEFKVNAANDIVKEYLEGLKK